MPDRSPPPHDEVVTAFSSHDALTLSNIQALRAMSDQMSLMANSQERMANELQITRETVIRLEAQDLKATIIANRTEALGAVAKLRADLEADIKSLESRQTATEGTIARIRGMVIPIATIVSALAAGLLAFLSQWAANVLSVGYSGSPHIH